jgi:RNA polymerase sigma-70 factor (ECF subfamily)
MDRQASNVNSGPSEAFVRDLTAHQSRLRGLIRCLLFDPTDVEDVWQDTNVLLIKKAQEFQPGTDFWAWSSCIARYQVLTHCKKVKRSRVIFSTDALEALAADFDALRDRVDPRRDALQACLALLPLPQRQLLELRYGPRISVTDIAARVKRPVGSVRQSLYRIRAALLACIERRLAGEGAA